ncbi:MAG: RNA polymerase sigma-70 factor [Planctomycetota bacterium]
MSPSVADIFEKHRPQLLGLAYRMLGTMSDTDDVLQEAFLRWSRVDPQTVETPGAYLRSVVTRLCIDHRRSVQSRREQYIGPWLPEPVGDSSSSFGEDRGEMAESLSMAFLVLLETLSPTERAAYLLRKVFDYEYGEISGILDKSEANCRQMVHRAEQHLRNRRPRFDISSKETERLASEFLRACSTGDIDGLVQLLADDAVLVSDGGGKAIAARRPISGADNIARFLIGVVKKSPAGFKIEPVIVNGELGYAAFVEGTLTTVYAFEASGGKVTKMFIVRNPDKLQRFTSIAALPQ